MTRSRRDTSTVLAQVADIDYQMYQTLQSMPLAIQEARSVALTLSGLHHRTASYFWEKLVIRNELLCQV